MNMREDAGWGKACFLSGSKKGEEGVILNMVGERDFDEQPLTQKEQTYTQTEGANS